MVNLGKTFGALLASVEHRYYGESMPTGSPTTGLDNTNIQNLLVDQALLDVNDAIATIRTQFAADASAPVILFGGSYPGALVGWHRVKYPLESLAALSSSGVVHSIEQYIEFDQTIARVVSPKCRQVLQATTNAFVTALNAGGATAAAAKGKFGAPAQAMSDTDFYYMLADSAAMGVQYGGKDLLCSSLPAATTDEELM
jgi:hypothetical protein